MVTNKPHLNNNIMKKSALALLLPLAVVALSCQPDEPKQKEVVPTSATFVGKLPASKTYVKDARLLWKSLDKIYIFSDTDLSAPAEFSITDGANSSVGKFAGEIKEGTAYYAVHTQLSDPKTLPTYTDGIFTAFLPTDQTAYAEDCSTAVMVAKGDAKKSLSFQNALGAVKFEVLSDDVTKVEFSGNAGEKLAGNITVAFDGSRIQSVEGSSSATLVIGDGKTALSQGVKFFSVVPGTFAQGITMKMTKLDGSVIEKKWDSEIKVESNYTLTIRFVALPDEALEIGFPEVTLPETGDEQVLKSSELIMQDIYLATATNAETFPTIYPTVQDAAVEGDLGKVDYEFGVISWTLTTDEICTNVGKEISHNVLFPSPDGDLKVVLKANVDPNISTTYDLNPYRSASAKEVNWDKDGNLCLVVDANGDVCISVRDVLNFKATDTWETIIDDPACSELKLFFSPNYALPQGFTIGESDDKAAYLDYNGSHAISIGTFDIYFDSQRCDNAAAKEIFKGGDFYFYLTGTVKHEGRTKDLTFAGKDAIKVKLIDDVEPYNLENYINPFSSGEKYNWSDDSTINLLLDANGTVCVSCHGPLNFTSSGADNWITHIPDDPDCSDVNLFFSSKNSELADQGFTIGEPTDAAFFLNYNGEHAFSILTGDIYFDNDAEDTRISCTAAKDIFKQGNSYFYIAGSVNYKGKVVPLHFGGKEYLRVNLVNELPAAGPIVPAGAYIWEGYNDGCAQYWKDGELYIPINDDGSLQSFSIAPYFNIIHTVDYGWECMIDDSSLDVAAEWMNYSNVIFQFTSDNKDGFEAVGGYQTQLYYNGEQVLEFYTGDIGLVATDAGKTCLASGDKCVYIGAYVVKGGKKMPVAFDGKTSVKVHFVKSSDMPLTEEMPHSTYGSRITYAWNEGDDTTMYLPIKADGDVLQSGMHKYFEKNRVYPSALDEGYTVAMPVMDSKNLELGYTIENVVVQHGENTNEHQYLSYLCKDGVRILSVWCLDYENCYFTVQDTEAVKALVAQGNQYFYINVSATKNGKPLTYTFGGNSYLKVVLIPAR